MKKRIKIITIAAVLFLQLFTSCEALMNLGTKWTFDNYTSYNVDIKLDSGSPKSFTVKAYSSEDCYVIGDTISYTYNYAGVVKIVQSGTTLYIHYK